jgi:hypothetical protein
MKKLAMLRSNAGFDPAKFRIDAYGNVLYRDADPGSPLSWETDYWFPHSSKKNLFDSERSCAYIYRLMFDSYLWMFRSSGGGKAVPTNLRIVQWQASQRRREKLEFLVPWWDLQLGVSVNQFLAVFSSENNEFR